MFAQLERRGETGKARSDDHYLLLGTVVCHLFLLMSLDLIVLCAVAGHIRRNYSPRSVVSTYTTIVVHNVLVVLRFLP